MPSSMLTSRMLAPPRTCSSATSAAAVQLPDLTRRANFFEPVTLVRSPIIWKLAVGPERQRLEAGVARDETWTSGDGTAGARGRGGRPATALAMARM